MAAGDINGKSDPYCKYGIGPRVGTWTIGPFTTKVKKSTLNPVWKAKDKTTLPECNFNNLQDEFILIEVWDADFIGRDDRLGFCHYPVKDCIVGKKRN